MNQPYPQAAARSLEHNNGYTQADNWLWDHVMPRARPNTFKIVCIPMMTHKTRSLKC